jgi:hypothetical protein
MPVLTAVFLIARRSSASDEVLATHKWLPIDPQGFVSDRPSVTNVDYFEALVAASLSRSRAPFRMSVSA